VAALVLDKSSIGLLPLSAEGGLLQAFRVYRINLYFQDVAHLLMRRLTVLLSFRTPEREERETCMLGHGGAQQNPRSTVDPPHKRDKATARKL